jgi:hypothetical protein
MKRAIFTSISAIVLFTSCRKEEMAVALQTPQANQVYVSTWEPAAVSKWHLVQSEGTATYSYSRDIPQVTGGVTSDGLVAVYTKGYLSGDVMINKPMGLPFFLYTNEQQAVPFSWEIVKGDRKIDVMVKMAIPQQEQFVNGQEDVQFRYIVIPRDFLLKNNLTNTQVAKMSYQQLSELLNFEI